MGQQKLKFALLLILTTAVFVLFFEDGYFQPINPDTMQDAVLLNQDIRFPEMLFRQDKLQHSRWFSELLTYMTFNTVQPVYYALTGKKTESFFVAQGAMNGIAYMFFALMSACYISLAAELLSWTYIFSLLLIFACIASGGVTAHFFPFIFRFYHESVVANYVWTFDLLLLVFLPYWRYYIHGKWNDSFAWQIAWWTGILFTAVSSSCTTIIAMFLSGCGILILWYLNFIDNLKLNSKISLKQAFLSFPRPNDRLAAGFYLMLVFCPLALISESFAVFGRDTHTIFSDVNALHSLRNYFYIWREFILHGRYLKALCASGLILLLLAIYYKFFAGTRLKKSILKLFIACVFLISTALIYSFEIGTQVIPYRYRGTNLGGDTLFYLTWSLTFTILAGTVLLLKYEKFKILIPFAVMVAFSHILSFFNFKPFYEDRQKQIQGFHLIQELDRLSPPYALILLPDKYEPIFNMWGVGWRTSMFCDKMKITNTKHDFQYVPRQKFEEYYCQLRQASAQFTDVY